MGTGVFKLVQRHPEAFHQLPSLHHEALLRAHVRTATIEGFTPTIEDALVAPWLGPEGQAAHYRNIEQNDQRHTGEVQPRYREIDVPVLIVWGEDDTVAARRAGVRVARPAATQPVADHPGCSAPRPT